MKKWILLLCLTSCVNSGVPPATPVPQKNIRSVFVDSAVSGISYAYKGANGTTGSGGVFTCPLNEEVTISLKGQSKSIILGVTPCRAVISPLDIITKGQLTIEGKLSSLNQDERVMTDNLLVLLQSLDRDKNATNGISLIKADIDALIQVMNSKGISLTDFLSHEKFNEAVDQTLLNINGGMRVPVYQAEYHFKQSQTQCSNSGCDFNRSIDTRAPILKCFYGYSLAPLSGDQRAYQVSPSGETEENQSYAPTLIVLRDSNLAEVYRNIKGVQYEFKSNSWSEMVVEGKNQIRVDQILFSNQSIDWSFRNESGNIYQAGISLGNDNAQKRWSLGTDCSAPLIK